MASIFPPLLIGLAGVVLYWPLSALVNYPAAQEALTRGNLGCTSIWACLNSLPSPLLPAPRQLAQGLWAGLWPFWAPNSLAYNAFYTGLETMVGLLIALAVGIATALALTASPGFRQAALPWVVASQTVPVIALAPMLVVVLGQYGVLGWLPKAIVAAYLAYFPLAIGLAKGLASPEPLALDLFRTYHASPAQIYLRLRLPAARPYLEDALKVAVAAALVGAIVGEVSSISFVGLGKLLAENSRASNVVGTWVLLLASAGLGIVLVQLVSLPRRLASWAR